MAVRILHPDGPNTQVPFISMDARLVVWLGTGSHTANMNYVVLEPGEANVPHAHADSEDTIFILEGSGTVHDLTSDVKLEIRAGQAVHVPAGVVHAVLADSDERIVSVGGPAPADVDLLTRIGAVGA